MIGRVSAIARAVFADAVRRKTIYVVLLFAALMAVAIPSLPDYGVGVSEAVYREVALALTYAAAAVVTLVLAVSRVPGQIEHRTVYTMLSRDVRRQEYLVGTWAGIQLTMLVVIGAFGIVIVALGALVYGTWMWQLGGGILGIWFEAGVLAAFCVAVSSVASAPVTAMAALAFLFAGHVRSGLLKESDLLYRLYPSLDTFNVIAPSSHGTGIAGGYALLMVLVFLAWVTVLLLLGAIAFSGRDV